MKLEDRIISVKGPKGEIRRELHPEVVVEVKEKEIQCLPDKNSKKSAAFLGLTRALIFNMIKGVSDGYEKRLQIEGIGFKAKIEAEKLILNVGFSHSVEILQPEGIKFSVEKNIIIISGIDKELVGQTAAKVRDIKAPEPYKGKGIRYFGEVVKIKAGKKVVTASK